MQRMIEKIVLYLFNPGEHIFVNVTNLSVLS